MLHLNKLQYRLWVDDAIHHSNMYNVAYAFLLAGDLNVNKLRNSVQRLIAANPIYYSHIIPDENGKLHFLENTPFVLPFEIIELSENYREEDLETITDCYARIPLSVDSDCQCKFYLFHLKEYVWCFMPKFHHSVMDGMSMNAFCSQLSELYNGNSLYSFPLIQEYNHYLEQADCHQEDDYLYWKEYLSGTSLRVPLDCFEGKEPEHDGRYYFSFGECLFQQCDHFCLSEDTTLFRLLAAVWSATIGRFCPTESGRLVLDHTVNLCPEQFRQTLGNYVNNLPLKIKVTDSLREILTQIKLDRRKANIHKFITYTELIPRMRKEKLLSADDTLTIGIDYPIINSRLAFSFRRCTSRLFRQPQMDLGLDLCLAVEKGSEFHCHIRYKKHIPLYFVKELAEAFRHLLIQSIGSPDTPMDDFPLLSVEKEQIMMNVRPEIGKPGNNYQSVIERFKDTVKKFPHHTAIIYGNKSMDYTELYERMLCTALWIQLETEGKLDEGAPIGILMDRTPESIVALLGILASGHPYVPLDKSYPEKRIEFIINDCGIKQLIVNDSLPHFNEPCCVQKLSTLVEKKNLLKVSNSANEVAYIIYTSGTTGTPKGIPIRHYQLLNLADEQIRVFSIHPDSRVIYFASMSFDASVSEIFTALLSGAGLVIATEAERHDPELLLRLLEEEEVTCATIPPALLAVLPHRSLPALKTLVIAGDKCASHLLSFWKAGRTVINAYGPTENTVCATAGVVQDLHHIRNIGSPLHHVSCYVLDERMRLLPPGASGELYIGGVQLTTGYINRPELNTQKFVLNPFSTVAEKQADINTILYKSGDRVRLLPDGTLEFIGRIDAQLKIRGYRIEPAEIEQLICHFPGISQACVIARGKETDKRLIAYIQPGVGCRIEIPQLKKFLSSHLPNYMMPSGWVTLEEFPRNVNGKIDIPRLPEPELPKENDSPKNAHEVCLSQIAARLLGVESVGIDSDLPELGLDSLSVMNLVVEAGKFGLRISVSSVYRDRTIREIVKGSERLDYFWYNTYAESKPVLIIISGYPYFHQIYQHLADELAQQFSLFVFDSYNGHFKEEWSCEDLIDYYFRIATDILRDKTLYGITGYCLGGEFALLLADRLRKECSLLPDVWVMDGEAQRDSLEVSQVRFMDDPTVPDEINRQRDRMLKRLLSTFPQTIYSGKVHIALSAKPMTHLQFDSTRPDSPEDLEVAHKMHSSRPVLWKKYYPSASLIYLDTDHYHFLDITNVPRLVRFLLSDTDLPLK